MLSIMASIREVFDGLPTWAKYACVGGTLILVPKIAFSIRNKLKRPRKTPYKEDWKQGIIYVYQWPRMRSVPSISPYGVKLETWLRMAELPYENVKINLWLRSKEGMLPFVEMNGVEYADSAFIIRDLGKILGKEQIMEGHLTPEQKAASRALEKMLEMNTWWTYAFIRYVENEEKMVKEVCECMPISSFQDFSFMATMMFSEGMGKWMQDILYKTGIGRHSREDIIQIGLEDLKALSDYLGDKDYLMGGKPTKVDAVAFGLLSQARYFSVIESPHAQLMKEDEYSNLGRYLDRIRDRFWPDWKQIGETLELNTHLKQPLQ